MQITLMLFLIILMISNSLFVAMLIDMCKGNSHRHLLRHRHLSLWHYETVLTKFLSRVAILRVLFHVVYGPEIRNLCAKFISQKKLLSVGQKLASVLGYQCYCVPCNLWWAARGVEARSVLDLDLEFGIKAFFSLYWNPKDEDWLLRLAKSSIYSIFSSRTSGNSCHWPFTGGSAAEASNSTRNVDRCSFIYCEDVIGEQLSILDIFVKLSVFPSKWQVHRRFIVSIHTDGSRQWKHWLRQKQLFTSVETEMFLKTKVKLSRLTVEKLFARN